MLSVCVLAAAYLAACGGSDNNGYESYLPDSQGLETTVPQTPAENGEQPLADGRVPHESHTENELAADIWEHNFQRTIFQADNYEMLMNNSWKAVCESGAMPIVLNDTLYVPLSAAIMATNGEITENAEGEIINGVIHVPLHDLAREVSSLTVGWHNDTGTLIVTAGISVSAANVMYRDINNQSAAWYGSQNSIAIANNFVLMQRNSGGWPRGTGQGGGSAWNPADIGAINPAALTAADRARTDAYFGRGITSNETRFMLSMYEATRIEAFRESAIRGLNAIFNAQVANGGWRYNVDPVTSYHGAISFNDDAYSNIMELLLDIKNGDFPYFKQTQPEIFARIEVSFDRGLEAILDMQIWSEQQQMLTAWAQHHNGRQILPNLFPQFLPADPNDNTVLPTFGREFEPPSIAGSESLDVILFLMNFNESDLTAEQWERVQNAIHSAVAFFDYAKLRDVAFVQIANPTPNNRILGAHDGIDTARLGAGFRFLAAATGQPVGRPGNNSAFANSIISENLFLLDSTTQINSLNIGVWGRHMCVDTFEPLLVDRRVSANDRVGADVNNAIIAGTSVEGLGTLSAGALFPGAGTGFLRNLYRDPDGNLHPATICQSTGSIIRPGNGEYVFDLVYSYNFNYRLDRRSGYQFINDFARNLPGQYSAWLNRNGLSPAVFTVRQIVVTGANNVETISVRGATLQMNANVLPGIASNKNVIWSVTDLAGNATNLATIGENGTLVSAGNGTVRVHATAADGSSVVGTRDIVITGQ